MRALLQCAEWLKALSVCDDDFTQGGSKGKRTRDRRDWKMQGLKPADLWPMFLAATEAHGETEQFATTK